MACLPENSKFHVIGNFPGKHLGIYIYIHIIILLYLFCVRTYLLGISQIYFHNELHM
jgi:hypothetical protein